MSLAVDLSGKTILICGCHKGGIGGATARQVTLAGGAVVLLDKDQETVDACAAEVRALGGTAYTMVADLYDVAACEAVIPSVLRDVGPIDGIANVVGATRVGSRSSRANLNRSTSGPTPPADGVPSMLEACIPNGSNTDSAA